MFTRCYMCLVSLWGLSSTVAAQLCVRGVWSSSQRGWPLAAQPCLQVMAGPAQ